MKVKATKLGFYEHLRRYPDAVFDLADEKHFSKRWMEKVGENAKVGRAEAKIDGARKPVALSKAAKGEE